MSGSPSTRKIGRSKITPIPYKTDAEYRAERHRLYPQTFHKEFPTASIQKEYEHYKGLTDDAIKAKSSYQKTYNDKKDSFKSQVGAYSDEFQYYNSKYMGLPPEKHGAFVQPALSVEDAHAE